MNTNTPSISNDLSLEVEALLSEGQVIPAHPLALTTNRTLDERCQRALARYYLAAGVGGIAVGVHTTQFSIRRHGLYEPVLTLAAEEMAKSERTLVKVAGVMGETKEAIEEASLAAGLGYDLGLVGLAGLDKWSESELVTHVKTISEIIPVFGFYLQPLIGGRRLGYEFWREIFELQNVRAVKVAPFNRYGTLEVARALWDSGRENDVYLYTGNDDTIVHDLLCEFSFDESSERKIRFRGGLLGHWAVWTKRAVELLAKVKAARGGDSQARDELLSIAPSVTEMNRVLFDASNGFKGCVPGINEVLKRQGLIQCSLTLDTEEVLSQGQAAALEHIGKCYPSLTDGAFIKEHLSKWLE